MTAALATWIKTDNWLDRQPAAFNVATIARNAEGLTLMTRGAAAPYTRWLR